MVKYEHEILLTLAQTAKRLPSRPHISTVARWISRGVRGRKLLATIIGGRRFVSEQALNEFLATLNEPGLANKAAGMCDRSREAQIKKAYHTLNRENM